MTEDVHPSEGDTLVLTDTVYSRTVIGTGLPANAKLANSDQRFDRYPVEVVSVKDRHKPNGDISRQVLTLETPDGDVVQATYRGREPIAGTPGGSITARNSHDAEQAYVWEKA